MACSELWKCEPIFPKKKCLLLWREKGDFDAKSNENCVPRQDNIPSLLFEENHVIPILGRMQPKMNAEK